jgi:hypothetical protein
VHSSIRVALRVAAALVLVFLVHVDVGRAADAAEAMARAASRCQRTVASGGQAFVARQLSDLGRCVGRALACVETGPDDPECLAKAGGRCERLVARILRRESKVERLIAARCADLEPAALLGDTGLGFARLGEVCPALATGHGDAAVLGACVAGLARCRGEGLFAAAVPRAGELLRVAGVQASLRDALACLPDRGGSGRGARDAVTGTAVTRCARGVGRASERLVRRTMVNVAFCTRATHACLDTAEERETCLDDAALDCAGGFARVDAARRSFVRVVASACDAGAFDFETLAGPTATNLGALADECGAVGIDDVRSAAPLAECLARRHDCDVSALLRDQTPRTDALLALVDQSLEHAYCGGGARPTPVATPMEIATPTSTGPTRTARPGETATPTPHATPKPEPTVTPGCGNGVLDDGEECDGDLLDDNTCDDLCFEVGAENPVLVCTDCHFDFSGCQGTDCEAS